ncbi:hypothetical protein JI435_307620 [Parastagonospora nodorum SN15]|uniref:Secreted protein n=1 Tax=Phaeosphaeria nodorum (strain SN15 / ATCC MYA-4574 / FGSC 10173) TaxID=321614 RepID=A0A7U2FC25_PHANO|nr:hypothetical protein JI435_307620 [Parastagonospora nodorum SN15]
MEGNRFRARLHLCFILCRWMVRHDCGVKHNTGTTQQLCTFLPSHTGHKRETGSTSSVRLFYEPGSQSDHLSTGQDDEFPPPRLDPVYSNPHPVGNLACGLCACALSHVYHHVRCYTDLLFTISTAN